MLCQRLNVRRSFSEWRQVNGYYFEAIVKVPAELSFLDQTAQILIAGCDNPHTYLVLRGAANPSKGAIFQDTQ